MAESGAALVPPPSGFGKTQLRSVWGHLSMCHEWGAPSPDQHDPRLCSCQAGTALLASSLSLWHMPPSMARPSAGLTSESIGDCMGDSVLGPLACTLFASWMERWRRGRGHSCEVCPLHHAEEGSVPQGHEWTLQLLHPSPGTVEWRQKGHHQPRTTSDPPASQ